MIGKRVRGKYLDEIVWCRCLGARKEPCIEIEILRGILYLELLGVAVTSKSL